MHPSVPQPTLKSHNTVIPVEELDRPTIRKLEEKGRKQVQKITSRLTALIVEYVSIDSIYPNPYNPNRQSEHEFDLLKKSILEDGFTQPVIIQKSSRMIVDGEHRWRALNQLGLKEIPVVSVEMNDQQMRIATLRHNRARGSEDIELSIQVLRDLRELGGLDKAVESLEIDDVELQAMLDDLPAPELMAGVEFSEAWTPDKTADAVEPERVLKDRRVSTTLSAQHALEKVRDQKDQSTTMLEERDISYATAREVTQVTATFTNQDAVMVRQVLGLKPAQKLIELCVKVVLANQDKYEQWVYEMALGVQARWK